MFCEGTDDGDTLEQVHCLKSIAGIGKDKMRLTRGDDDIGLWENK